MVKRYAGLKAFGSKAVSVVASGALALSLTPAIALADPGAGAGDLQVQAANLTTQHYEYNNKTGRAIIGDDGDPLNNGIEVVKPWDGASIQYKGFAHSDNGAHYQGYSLYTDITTDGNGTLTAIDITSGDDTFAGVWGYSQKSGRGAPVEGFLPDGVEFIAPSENSDGTWTPELKGWEAYNETKPVPTVTLMSVNADGTGDSTAAAGQEGGKIVSETGSISGGKITIPAKDGDADYYNLVRCQYMIGSEKTTFNTYFSVGTRFEDADKYIDNCIADTTWEKAANSTTNREGWTGIMGTMTLRMLQSWGATMADPSLASGIDGEIGAIDTVSGATKTATPFAAALNQARADGYIKAVSENVKVTIDGARVGEEVMPALSINKSSAEGADNFQDAVSVTKNADGTYTLAGSFKPYGGGRLSLDALTAFDLSGVKLGTAGIMALSKELPTSDFQFQNKVKWQVIPDNPSTDSENPTGKKFYDADDESHIIAFGAKMVDSDASTVSSGGRGAAVTYNYDLSDKSENAYVTSKFTKSDDSTINFKITIKQDITHFAMTYTLGHGRITSVYDLENQAKVADTSATLAAASASNSATVTAARAAYDATPYDVRPFTTGIDNLEKQEAAIVSTLLDGASASDEAAVAAARAAYDKLDAAAKAQVESAAVAKLATVEKEVADAKEIAAVEALIAALPANAGVADKAAVEAARAAYSALSSDLQAKVGNLKALEAAEASVKAAEDAASSQASDTSASSGLAENEQATTGSGASAATVVATSATEVAYVAPASSSAKKVTVPDTVEVNGQTYNVTSIKANAFKGSKATSVTVGKNVKTIAAKAFNGASKLKSVSLGKGVAKLSKGAFKGAAKLAKVTISSSKLTKSSALKGAFKGSKVKTVVLKNMTAKQKKAVKKAILKYGGKSVTVK